ncbi:hypothetical protein A2239_02890 [Candidatus Uhrbacteria bacterium RIFOXYA2_FULL_40_9]|uniref:Glycosyl transferase group 1 n=2 Tax=Candidatus Uhriibacteriota TaxID=1752732 RepID=A0A0G1Q4W6_9BACT|nr:MAG: Glycosyl transferase group 1 [Candidatus Uhrbacteria bacterium GW2011_GWF2_46_218]KKU40066.1 MAG: Glycosyl transferase group 1 [Candidatus Uhrbacteria bacterium GW2011_GWE2_46_68]OGL92707.1 MAG: hypothetical protein A2239_02890 [Candidatus Uhrbacteria bacterium RIFOXYA2_FULL_40_9]
MKIIQADKFYYLRSGASRYLLELEEFLKKQGHEVMPFAMRYPQNLKTPFERYFVSEVQTQNVRFNWEGLRTFCRMFYSLEARRKLATLIFDNKPDVCHLHNIYTQISPSILHTLKDKKVPVVMTVHDHHLVSPQYNIWAHGCGPNLKEIGWIMGIFSRFHKHSFIASLTQVAVFSFHRFLQIYQKNVDLFLCPSQYMHQQLIQAGFPKEKVRTVRYGIDLKIITPCYEQDGYFLFVGRLSEEKGGETILKLAKLLPDISFKIVGAGPEADFLHKQAQELQNVEFVGFKMGDALLHLYQRSTAVLLPSRVEENFPLILLEAMAAGKPVIASDVGGVPEIVEDHVNGLLVKPLHLHGWTEAVMRLYYDEDYRQQLAKGARTTVEQRFRLEDHQKAILNIYQEMRRKNSE